LEVDKEYQAKVRADKKELNPYYDYAQDIDVALKRLWDGNQTFPEVSPDATTLPPEFDPISKDEISRMVNNFANETKGINIFY